MTNDLVRFFSLVVSALLGSLVVELTTTCWQFFILWSTLPKKGWSIIVLYRLNVCLYHGKQTSQTKTRRDMCLKSHHNLSRIKIKTLTNIMTSKNNNHNCLNEYFNTYTIFLSSSTYLLYLIVDADFVVILQWIFPRGARMEKCLKNDKRSV